MSGRTILLLPGLLSDRTVWEPLLDALDGDARVPDLTGRDHLTAMARDCLALAEGPLRVAGHSMGARVAMEMARLAPDRVERLALLDTGIHPLGEGERERRADIVAFAREHGMRALAERWLPGMVHPDRRDDPGLMGPLEDMVLRHDAAQHERQVSALVARPDAGVALGEIGCPVLLMVGRQDAWSPVAQHEDMLARLPHARLVVIEEAGHFAPLERPRAVLRELLPFLSA